MSRGSTIIEILRKKSAVILILLSSIYCIYPIYKDRWKGAGGDDWRMIIGSDGFGYYAYLPCIFINHNFNFDKIVTAEKEYRPGIQEIEYTYIFTSISNGRMVDKCFAGEAILIMPFFLIAYFLSSILGLNVTGYSPLFAASVSFAALFYMILGLLFIRKLMKLFSISEFNISVSLLALLFGTNLFYYGTMQPSMSHIYTFFLTSIFLYYSKKAIDESKFKYGIFMAITLGILVIIRPTNLLIVFMLPVLAGSWEKTKDFILYLFKRYKICIFFLAFMGVVFIQFICWKLETGNFFVWSYPGEGFNFKEFHFTDILFSYHKGWFIYTPFMFIVITGGLISLLFKNRFIFFFSLLFFIIVTYVLSSWHNWWYGASFGSRPFIDFYPAFILFFAFFLASFRSLFFKAVVLIICMLCIGLNFFQVYQANNFILPQNDVDKKMYWKLFLKSSNIYCGIFNYADTTKYKYIDTLAFQNKFDNNTSNGGSLSSSGVYNPSHPILLYSENTDSPTLTLDGSKLKSIKNIDVYVKVWAFTSDLDNDAKVIVNIHDKNGNLVLWSWKSFQGFLFEKNKWTQAYFVFQLPEIKPDDIIKILAFNSEGLVCMDDMEVKFCTPL
jgi:hypothetical protein